MQFLFLTNAFAAKMIYALCWMLIHSLWQGLICVIITGAVMMLTTRSVASVRYNIVSGLFFFLIGVCCLTFIRELNHTGTAQVFPYANTFKIHGNALQDALGTFIDYSSSHSDAIVITWFIIFCFRGAKLSTAFVYNNRVRNNTSTPSALWKKKLVNFCGQLHVKRKVSLFESEIVKIPVVIGHLKPIILIPVGLLNNLPPRRS